MSRETVYALRRFTEKLANTPVTMGANPALTMPGAITSGQELGLGDTRDSIIPRLRNNMDEPSGLAALGNKHELVEYKSPTLDTKRMLPPGAEDYAKLTNTEVPDPGYTPRPESVDPQTWQQYLMGLVGNPSLLGAGLGGLGAYGLARMLRSKKDEEENRFPWLATLLGAGAGGLLVPALANNPYVQSAGASIGNMAGNAATGVKNMATSGYNAVTGAKS